jgi:hypothetical protein
MRGPDVAPLGTVATMDVLLQELIVMAVSFKVTALPLCVAPKPDPAMTIWLPAEPVVTDTLVIAGAGLDGVVSETPSNVTVARELVVRLLT